MSTAPSAALPSAASRLGPGQRDRYVNGETSEREAEENAPWGTIHAWLTGMTATGFLTYIVSGTVSTQGERK